MNTITKSSIKCLIYIIILFVTICGGLYAVISTKELIAVSLGAGIICGLLFILINIESQKIEKYLLEEEEKQQDL